jgi:hypothetical protein
MAEATETARRFRRICSECGVEFRAAMKHADFCGTACRKLFNNRRLTRGAELYDLIMVLRFDRGPAQLLKVWNLICRLASEYRAEDQRERAGRKSWRSAREIIDRRPYLAGTVVANVTYRKAA